MIYKCTNGYIMFIFESIQEFEILMDKLPIPNLVPVNDRPLTFIPETQAGFRYLIAGVPISNLAIPSVSNADVIKGFKDNGFTYSFMADGIVPRAMINTKVNLDTNRFGKFFGNFMLQPYSLVGFSGRAVDFEAIYDPNRGVFVYSYIRFEL